MRTQTPRARHGFTVIEILVVMTIIAILAGLLLVGVQAALSSGKRAVVTMNLNQLENALNIYKNKYGDFPPSHGFTNNNLNAIHFTQHMRKAHKMISPPATIVITDLSSTAQNSGTSTLEFEDMQAPEALVFYLGGMPAWGVDPQGRDAVNMKGLSRQPQNPFDRNATQRTEVLVDFVQMGELLDKDGDKWPELYLDGADAPVVYFKGGQYSARIDPSDPSSNIETQVYVSAINPQWGSAAPYALQDMVDANDKGEWLNGSGVQLIHCGSDNVYDVDPTIAASLPLTQYRVLPFGANVRPGELDNQTNFADGVLENFQP